MKYELAKELRDAGFPQRRPLVPRPYTPDVVFGEANEANFEIDTGVYIPTLSELIEACGDHLIDIVKTSSTHWRVHGQGNIDWNWLHGGRRDWGYSITGKSPEEAAAKLWLALNPVDGKK